MARSGVAKPLASLTPLAPIRNLPKPLPLLAEFPAARARRRTPRHSGGTCRCRGHSARPARRRSTTSGTSMFLAGCREDGDVVRHCSPGSPRLQRNRSYWIFRGEPGDLIAGAWLAYVGDMVRVGVASGAALPVAMVVLALALIACGQNPATVELRQPWQAARAAPSKPPPNPVRAPAPAGARVVTVARGDTVYGLARRHGASVRAIIEANGLAPPFFLRIGQKLELPASRRHLVKPGETVYAISRLYDVDMSSLTRLNRIAPPYSLAVGQSLFLPGRVNQARPPSRSATTQAARPAPAVQPKPVPPSKAIARAVPKAPPRAGKRFAWPLQGKIISAFGPKAGGLHNDGINIAGRRGSPVLAAENGVVAYTGNELRGFGHLVLLRHAGGWITAYAHNEKVLVRRGDKVRIGQAIARLGATGNVSRPQLHFEIRRGSKAVDPLRYLAPRTAALTGGNLPGDETAHRKSGVRSRIVRCRASPCHLSPRGTADAADRGGSGNALQPGGGRSPPRARFSRAAFPAGPPGPG